MHIDAPALLLEIYRLAHEATPTTFLHRALHVLRAQVPFDAACLCRCETSRGYLNIHTACLHDLPDDLIREYPKIEKHDPVATAVTRQPGLVHTFGPEDCRWQGHEMARQYWQQYGFKYFHAIALPVGDTHRKAKNAWLLALLASPPSHSRQCQTAHLPPILPHLLESQLVNHLWALHQAEHVDIEHYGLATALYCPASVGYNLICGPDFDALLETEFGRRLPEHGIHHLPAPLLALAKAVHQAPIDNDKKEPPARHKGKQGVFVFHPQSAGHVLIHGRKRLPIDTLTKTELEIAELTAKGLTYKEIARERGISPNTARNHLVNIRIKLNSQTTQQNQEKQ